MERARRKRTAFTFKYGDDQDPPELSPITLTTSDDPDQYVAEQSPTFYYDDTASGTLTVTLVATDIPAGLNVITYPHMFAAGDGGDPQSLGGQQGPLTLTYEYEVEGTSAVSDTFSVEVTDTDLHNAANAASVDFNVVQDTENPTVTIAAPAVSGLGIPVSWAGEDDRSGIRSYQVQVKETAGVGKTGSPLASLLPRPPSSAQQATLIPSG
jgi:hypothetical protein